MTDILSENPIPLSAARLLLPGRGSRHPDCKTLKGWVRGGKLEAVKIGGTWFTSEAAIRRFAERPETPEAVRPRTPAQRKRAVDAARRRVLAKW